MISITNSMVVNKDNKKLILWVCFIAYLLLLGYMLFFSSYFGRDGHDNYRYNLIFLQEIGRFYHYGIRTGEWELFVLNVFGNIGVFIPIGLFLPKLFQRCKNALLTTVLTFELSFVIEIIQLLTKVGSFDVDDLFLNALGGLCGYIVYRICHEVKAFVKKRLG